LHRHTQHLTSFEEIPGLRKDVGVPKIPLAPAPWDGDRMIHVLDVLTVAPGRVDEVRRMMRADYLPVVAALDMRLVHEWLTPAVELVDRPTELLYLWELDDVPAFWRMRTAAARDPRVTALWDDIAPLLTTRDRKLMCDPADATVLR
jgi:hypothetical protein